MFPNRSFSTKNKVYPAQNDLRFSSQECAIRRHGQRQAHSLGRHFCRPYRYDPQSQQDTRLLTQCGVREPATTEAALGVALRGSHSASCVVSPLSAECERLIMEY